jgi:cobalt-precorrin-7 (C5)-methyltransferase
MEKIQILGLGPGGADYVLPVTLKKIREASVIAAGKRNLLEVERLIGRELRNSEKIMISAPLEPVVKEIRNARKKGESVAVVVSGDPGFYSMLTFMKKHFSSKELEVTPGISSMQVFFARLSIPWQNAYIGSLHGKTGDLEAAVYHHPYSFFLTDQKHTPEAIKKELYQKAEKDPKKKEILQGIKIHIGERLTYPDEKITSGLLWEVTNRNDNLCVVVLENENYGK